MNGINSNSSERDAGGNAPHAFPYPALATRTNAPAGEAEILRALRVHADALTLRAKDAAEWASVILANAQCDSTVVDAPLGRFDSIVNSLAQKGFYRPINADRGWVRMS
jgi:hypothetical protein